ncbi:progranulin [Trichonephila clavata]|uniref:Progranulin n=1 Tax=Trichonephila clavata TaxID=2740835 RepID=A0A8X6HYD6_TRICU|nr:progranulin [Trichonephila clavata]
MSQKPLRSTSKAALKVKHITYHSRSSSQSAAGIRANAPGVACDTQCKYGCCSYNNGVFCDDGTECCKEHQTCMPDVNMCLGIEDTGNGSFSLYSEKTTPVGGLLCPETATACSRGCCPHTNAVCCNDEHSCCPAGFECSLNGCVSNEMDNSTFLRKSIATQDPENTDWEKKLKDMKIQICPDKLHLCSASADCCRRDDGTWDCCPKVLNLKGECCTQYGYYRVCCFDLAPKCHWWGCWFS